MEETSFQNFPAESLPNPRPTDAVSKKNKSIVALSYGRKWDSAWMAQRKRLIRLLRGGELNHRAQGKVRCQPQFGVSWRCFCALESKGKRNSVTKAFYMWRIQRTHSHCEHTATGTELLQKTPNRERD